MEREEAIEVIRENWPDSGYTSLREALETLIPELKESEDERIRKWLINLIDKMSFEFDEPFLNGETWRQKVLAWLEKQKDNTPIVVSNDDWDCQRAYSEGYQKGMAESNKQKPNVELIQKSWYLEGYHDGKYNNEPKWLIQTGKGGTMYEENPKYGTQNPVEWSEDFEENIRILLHDKLTWHSEDGSMSSTVFIDDKTLKDIISGIWFYVGKEALKYPNKEFKGEWSEDYREEDIQTRFAFYTYKDDSSVLYLSNVFVEEASRNHGFGTRILKAAEKVAEAIGAITICLKVKQDSPANAWYRKHGYGYVTFEDGYDWLKKNLEYLKPAKSAEWSEEDERNLYNTIEAIKYTFDVSEGSGGSRLITWLKFHLRPQSHWKPSKK